MAKTAKKKSKANKKSARVVAKPKAAIRAAKTARKKPAAGKAARARKPQTDPLNRKQYRAITPMLAISDIRRAIDFYTGVFGFAVKQIMDTPRGIMHAELTLRDTTLMLGPEEPGQKNLSANSIGNTPLTLYILVDDVDQVFATAVARGGRVSMPIRDTFWGDRCGMVSDPEGNKWMIATHKANVTEAQMMEAVRQWEQQAAAGAGQSGD
jgi:PhnB protein